MTSLSTRTSRTRSALVRRQYSGNAHGVIKGIGVVNGVYVNPLTKAYWLIDYRIYGPDGDGKINLDHVRGMLSNLVEHKDLPFRRVLMDTWYATKRLMPFIESLGKVYYCPLRENRLVDDSGGTLPYRHVSTLEWDAVSLAYGKKIEIKSLPKQHKVKLFRVKVPTHRTDWVVTNDLTQSCSSATQDACGLRWKIEQFHREARQLTCIERCQCRKACIQRNHIACAVRVWIRLAQVARQTARSLYQVKHGMLNGFLRLPLKNPSARMEFT